MHRVLGVLAALFVSASLLTAGSAVAADDPALTGAPTVDSCYLLTPEQVGGASVDQAPVDCATPHTTQLIAVDRLPDHLSWSGPEADVQQQMSFDCWRAFVKEYGPDTLQLYRSQYSVAYFGPDAAQQAAGARWFSCHVVVLEDDGLAELPNPLPRLSRKLPDSVATCLTKAGAFTTCADTHSWRSAHAFYATGKATKKNVTKVAKRVCPRKVSTRAWYYTWQDLPGKTFIVGCYARTNR